MTKQETKTDISQKMAHEVSSGARRVS